VRGRGDILEEMGKGRVSSKVLGEVEDKRRFRECQGGMKGILGSENGREWFERSTSLLCKEMPRCVGKLYLLTGEMEDEGEALMMTKSSIIPND
jgi:hypothetical protein